MAEARGRSLWAHTSALLALHANINRDPKRRSRPYKPDDFNPYVGRRKKRRPVTVEQLTRDVLDVTGVEPRRKR